MRTLSILLLVLVLSPVVTAQCPSTTGPDVIVGAITDVGNYGTDGSGHLRLRARHRRRATSATVPVIWVAGTNQHPVIAPDTSTG